MNIPAKSLITLILILPAILYADQEADMELFDFLAMYDQSDNVFIDAEMDERIETAEADKEADLANQKVMKSKSDE